MGKGEGERYRGRVGEGIQTENGPGSLANDSILAGRVVREENHQQKCCRKRSLTEKARPQQLASFKYDH